MKVLSFIVAVLCLLMTVSCATAQVGISSPIGRATNLYYTDVADYGTLEAAVAVVTAEGGGTIVVNSNVTVSTDLTVPSNIAIEGKCNKGKITVATGKVLNIQGQFSADKCQVFQCVGDEVCVRFGAQTVNAYTYSATVDSGWAYPGRYVTEVDPVWWGADPNYTSASATATTRAINAAIKSLNPVAASAGASTTYNMVIGPGGTVRIDGQYYVNGTIRVVPKVSLIGNNTGMIFGQQTDYRSMGSSGIYCSQTDGTPCVTITADTTLIQSDCSAAATGYHINQYDLTKPKGTSLIGITIQGNSSSGYGVMVGSNAKAVDDGMPYCQGTANSLTYDDAAYETTIRDCRIAYHGKSGIRNVGGATVRIEDNYIGYNDWSGIYGYYDTNSIMINNNHIQQNCQESHDDPFDSSVAATAAAKNCHDIYLFAPYGAHITNNTIEASNVHRDGVGIETYRKGFVCIRQGTGNVVSNNYFEGTPGAFAYDTDMGNLTSPGTWTVPATAAATVLTTGCYYNYCTKVASVGSNAGAITYALTVRPSTDYEISYYFKKGTADNGTVKVTGGAGDLYSVATLSDSDWTQHTGSFTTGAGDTSVTITLQTNDATDGEYSLFDQVVVGIPSTAYAVTLVEGNYNTVVSNNFYESVIDGLPSTACGVVRVTETTSGAHIEGNILKSNVGYNFDCTKGAVVFDTLISGTSTHGTYVNNKKLDATGMLTDYASVYTGFVTYGAVNSVLSSRDVSYKYPSTTHKDASGQSATYTATVPFTSSGLYKSYLNLGNIAFLGSVDIELISEYDTAQAVGFLQRRCAFYHAEDGVTIDELSCEIPSASGYLSLYYAIGDPEITDTNQISIPVYQNYNGAVKNAVGIRATFKSKYPAHVSAALFGANMKTQAAFTPAVSQQYPTYEAGLKVKGKEGGNSTLYLWADEGDDAADKWSIVSKASDNKLEIRQNDVVKFIPGADCIIPESYGAIAGSVSAAQRTANTTAINAAIAAAWVDNAQANTTKKAVCLSSWYETDGSIVIKGAYNRIKCSGSEVSGIINNSTTAHHITMTGASPNTLSMTTIEGCGIKGVADAPGDSVATFIGTAAVATQNGIDITGPTSGFVTIKDCDISWVRNHGVYAHTSSVSGVRIVDSTIRYTRGDGANLVAATAGVGNGLEFTNNLVWQTGGWCLTWGAYGANITGNLFESCEKGGVQVQASDAGQDSIGPVAIKNNYFEMQTLLADPQAESCITMNIPSGHYLFGVDISSNLLYVGAGAVPATNTTWRASVYGKGGGGIVSGKIGPDFYFAENAAYVDVLTADGTFATNTGWTAGTGWTITGGKAVHTSLGGTAALEGTLTGTEYQFYKITFTISDRTAGSVLVYIGGMAESMTYSTDGTYQVYIQNGAGESNYPVKFVPTSTFDGKIDDVTVTQGNIYVDLSSQGYAGLLIYPYYPASSGGRVAQNLSSARAIAKLDDTLWGTYKSHDSIPSTTALRTYLDYYNLNIKGQVSANIDYGLNMGSNAQTNVGGIQIDVNTDAPQHTPYMATAHWFYAGATTVATGQTLNASTTDITVTSGGGNIMKYDYIRILLADGSYYYFQADAGSTTLNLKVLAGTTSGSGTTSASSEYHWSRWSPVMIGMYDNSGNGYVGLIEKYLKITGAEGGDAQIQLYADQGDDASDKWSIESNADNHLYFKNNGISAGDVSTSAWTLPAAHIGGAFNYMSVDGSGVASLVGSAKRILRMRPVMDVAKYIGGGSKPTYVTRGAVGGYSFPIYASDNEELFFRDIVPGRWDGSTSWTCGLFVYLASAEDVGDKFKFQLSHYGDDGVSGTTGSSVVDVEVETAVTTGHSAQYSNYHVVFTINASGAGYGPGWPVNYRLRRIDAADPDITGEVVVKNWYCSYTVDKLFSAP